MILVDSCGWLELLASAPLGDVYRPALAKADELVVPLDAALALEAARLGPATGLPCADSIIYATALHHGAELWTHDAHFRELPGVRFIAAPASG